MEKIGEFCGTSKFRNLHSITLACKAVSFKEALKHYQQTMENSSRIRIVAYKFNGLGLMKKLKGFFKHTQINNESIEITVDGYRYTVTVQEDSHKCCFSIGESY